MNKLMFGAVITATIFAAFFLSRQLQAAMLADGLLKQTAEQHFRLGFIEMTVVSYDYNIQ